jgi:hypothetical protein
MGYPTNAGMHTLLLAMKEDAAQDTAYLRYVQHYHIKLGDGFYYWAPWDGYTLCFEPIGSPETIVSEGTGGKPDVKYATHHVAVECVVPTQNPDTEKHIVGVTSKSVGLAEYVANTLDFFDGRPVIFLAVARLVYKAQTRAFERTNN